MTNEVIAFIALGVAFTILLFLLEKRNNRNVIQLNTYKLLYIDFFTRFIIENSLIPKLEYIKANLDSILPDDDFDHDMYSGDYGNSEMREFHISDEKVLTEIDNTLTLLIDNFKFSHSYERSYFKKIQNDFNKIRYTTYDKYSLDIMLMNMIYELNSFYIKDEKYINAIIDENKAIREFSNKK